MEQFCFSLVLLSVSFTSLFFSILFYNHRAPFTAPNLPPGKMGFPVIGESLEFLSSGWKGHPEKFILERMAKYSSNVFKTSLFREPMVMFCGVAGNKFFFSNEKKHMTPWWPPHLDKIFLSSESNPKEEAKKLKPMLIQFLSPQALQRYVSIMDDVAQRHFALEWQNKTQVTLLPLARKYTFLVSSRLFMNNDDLNQVEKLEKPFQKVAKGFTAVPIDLPGTSYNRAIKASKLIKEELLKIIKQRKEDLANGVASKTQDILSHMLSYCDENGQYMNESDIVHKIIATLLASYDTTTSTCTSIVKYLAEQPQNIYQKKVFHEQMEIAKSKGEGELLNWHDIEKMKYSWNVVCEVMRIATPVQGTFREAINDFVFNDFSIPKGWKLYWSAGSTHKNPECFKEPEKFDPSRFEGNGPAPYTFVPFGGGPRMCPGKEYARIEILVFIHNLVKRFKWETVIPNEKIIVDPLPLPAKGLPIRLYPHQA